MSDKRQWWLPEIREKHVRRGDVRDLLTSRTPKPAAHGLTLPKIGDGRMTTQQTVDVKYQYAGSRAKVSTHFPPFPVKAVVPQEVKKLGTCFSSSRPGFERPTMPAESCNKGRLLNRERLMPARLPPLDIKTQSSSSSSSSSRCRPKSGDLHGHSCKLPPIFERKEKPEKKHNKKLPEANGQSAECPRMDKAKKKKKKKMEDIYPKLHSSYFI